MADKSQTVRLVDIGLLGPFMIWYGFQDRVPAWAGTLMVVSGLLTMVYNARNYVAEREA